MVANARLYLTEHHRFSISVITRYEILRGLTVKGAIKQATVFEDFCVRNEVVPIKEKAGFAMNYMKTKSPRSGR